MKKIVLSMFAVVLYTGCLVSQNPVQTIRGTVVDGTCHEKLIGANVVIVNTTQGTITDTEGRFCLRNVPVGRIQLQVSYIGYEPVLMPELLVKSGREVVLDIQMEAGTSNIEEITIRPSLKKDRPVNSMASVSARAFSVEEAGRYAGAIDDPGRMAGNFAGVTTVGVNMNAIVVRGNAPKGLLWRLEGVNIPVPSHFSGASVVGGGGLTIFSSQLLANSDFYTGAFPAEYGNASAGVFDMKLRNGNNRKNEYTFQIGVQGIEASGEGPMNLKNNGSFLYNYRYSTMALIFPLLPEVNGFDEIPVYQDLSFKLKLYEGKAGTFSLWGIGGLSNTRMEGSDDSSEWVYPENRKKMNFHYNMGAGGLTHSKSISAKTYIRTTLALNAGEYDYWEQSRLDYALPGQLFPLFDVNSIQGAWTASSVITQKARPGLTFRYGVDAYNNYFTLKGTAGNFNSDQMQEFMDGDGNAWLIDGFFQGKYRISPELTLTAGVNASWFELNGEYILDPRISAGWQITQKQRLSIGYGKHRQIEPLFVYFVKNQNDSESEYPYPNKDLKRLAAHHFVLGYDYSVTSDLHLKIEPYYQKLFNVPVVEDTPWSMLNFMADWTFSRPLTNQGKGENYGIDCTLDRYLKKGLYYMCTLSLYKSLYTGGDGVERKTRYSGGYVINMLGGKEWTLKGRNMLGLNIKLTFMGPYYFQPVDIEETWITGDIVYDEEAPFTYRNSNMESMTDLSVSYRINGKKVSSVLKLQVKNLFGRQYRGKQFNLQTQSPENEYFTSSVPFLSYKVEF